ncbi:MAG: NmrA family protein [Aeromicrobium sp.]|nr:NmrA family protein [Aeromicrobium sp.]
MTGATGAVGGQVAAQLATAGVNVRALVRDSSAAKLPDGVEIARGDLSEPSSLEQPMSDVDAVFLMWPFMSSAGAHEVLDVIKRHARRVVYLSADGVRPDVEEQQGPILQFHGDLERAVEATGLEWVLLHPASFATNTLGWAPQIRGGVVREAFGSRVRALIHEADIAAVAVRALVDNDLLKTRPLLTGPEALTTAEQVTALGDALGIPVQFEEISPETASAEALAAGWPEDLVSAIFGGDFEPQQTTTTFQDITGRSPRSFQDWARDHAADFR